jgi:hypothetical protein
MMVTMAMLEMAMGNAMATETAIAMMLPPPLLVTLLMTMTAAIQGRQLDDGNWTTTMGQQQWEDGNVMAMGGQRHAECLQVLRHPSKATIN